MWSIRLPGPRPWPAPLAVATVAAAALAVLLLPRTGIGGSVWAPLVALFPDSALSCFALGWTGVAGTVAWQCAEAVRSRQALRRACTAVVFAALLAPVAPAVPLWSALLAGALLIALPEAVRPVAANDNPQPEPRTPFSLAA